VVDQLAPRPVVGLVRHYLQQRHPSIVLHAGERAAGWASEADRIRAAILHRGWNADVGAFTQTLDGSELDAAALMIPIVGFLPATDPRVQATIDAVATRLTGGRGLVYRYRTATGVDGLDGEEGTFLLCTFWLARALAMAGRTGEAREVFERAAAYVNDVGLLAEEIDPATGEQLGNTPRPSATSGWSTRRGRSTRPSNRRGDRSTRAARSGSCSRPPTPE